MRNLLTAIFLFIPFLLDAQKIRNEQLENPVDSNQIVIWGFGSGLEYNLTAEKTSNYTANKGELVYVGAALTVTSPPLQAGANFGVMIKDSSDFGSSVFVDLDGGTHYYGTTDTLQDLGKRAVSVFYVATDQGWIEIERWHGEVDRGTPPGAAGDKVYSTTGGHTWMPGDDGLIAGDTVTVVVIGAGGSGGRDGSHSGGGGAGGGLAYGRYVITSGDISGGISIQVGAGGAALTGFSTGNGNAGGQSYFKDATTIQAGGGAGGVISGTATGGTYATTNAITPKGGGNGGAGGGGTVDGGGGGGAGGYSGNGGAGGGDTNANGSAGSGGGGGGGSWCDNSGCRAGGGGGVGIYGEGSSGAGGSGEALPGAGGSGGIDGSNQNGGNYGGGGAFAQDYFIGEYNSGSGGNGVVRIVWGEGRSYPSTNVDQYAFSSVDYKANPTNIHRVNSPLDEITATTYTAQLNEYVILQSSSAATITPPPNAKNGYRFGVFNSTNSDVTILNVNDKGGFQLLQNYVGHYIYSSALEQWIIESQSVNPVVEEYRFTTTGSHTWYPPASLEGVKIEVLCIGGGASGDSNTGGDGGGGGGLATIHDTITASDISSGITVVVGAGGAAKTNAIGVAGGSSYFRSTSHCWAEAGGITENGESGGDFIGDFGGRNSSRTDSNNGGRVAGDNCGGGGGAAGYNMDDASNDYGRGYDQYDDPPINDMHGYSGGGAGGEDDSGDGCECGGGGGTGIFGQGSNGVATRTSAGLGGGGGSGGGNGKNEQFGKGGDGGLYGGGGAGVDYATNETSGAGGQGIVRILVYTLGTENISYQAAFNTHDRALKVTY